MYESGEMVGMKFSFRRIGFNHALGEMLRGVGKVRSAGAMSTPGFQAAPQAEDSDDSSSSV